MNPTEQQAIEDERRPSQELSPAPDTADTRADEVAILLATFNGETFLPEQLDSIARQTHRNWTIYVSDDGSNDRTLKILQTFSQAQPGKVNFVPQHTAASARDNFFHLLKHAPEHSYFALCDQDDIWHHQKLQILVRRCQTLEAENAAQPCLVFSDLSVVNEHRRLIDASFMNQMHVHPTAITHRTLLVENSIPGCAMLFNGALAELTNYRSYDRDRTIMHDWWLALIASTTGKIGFVPVQLIEYRQHQGNTLGAVKRTGIRFAIKKLKQGRDSSVIPTYRQAQALHELYNDLMDRSTRDDVRATGVVIHKNKAGRIYTLLRNRILKQTNKRRFYQLIMA